MAPNAYIPIEVSEKLVEKVKKIIETEMTAISEGKSLTELEETVTASLFDEILHELEEKLAIELFVPFFKSKYYAEYKQRSALVEMKVRQKEQKASV